MNAISNEAWLVGGLTPAEKLVLVRLADRADKDGLCYPGQASIARECCVTTRAVSRAVRRLVTLGHLSVVKEPTWRDPRTYRVTPQSERGDNSSPPDTGSPPENSSSERRQEFTSPPENSSPGEVTTVHPNHQLTIIEPTTTPNGDLGGTSDVGVVKRRGRKEKPIATGSRPTKQRERNPLLDAVVEACGGNIAETTHSAWSGAAKALAEIRSVFPAVTPDHIWTKARAYREKMPRATLTPAALAKHWGALGGRTEMPGGGSKHGRASLEAEREQIVKFMPGNRTRAQDERLTEIERILTKGPTP